MGTSKRPSLTTERIASKTQVDRVVKKTKMCPTQIIHMIRVRTRDSPDANRGVQHELSQCCCSNVTTYSVPFPSKNLPVGTFPSTRFFSPAICSVRWVVLTAWFYRCILRRWVKAKKVHSFPQGLRTAVSWEMLIFISSTFIAINCYLRRRINFPSTWIAINCIQDNILKAKKKRQPST